MLGLSVGSAGYGSDSAAVRADVGRRDDVCEEMERPWKTTDYVMRRGRKEAVIGGARVQLARVLTPGLVLVVGRICEPI